MGCKWVFTTKFKPDGSLDRYKAQLGDKGLLELGLSSSLKLLKNKVTHKGYDVNEIRHLKEHLALEFEIKDLGPLKYFLGIKVVRSKKGLVEAGMSGCRPANTPIDPNAKFGNKEGRLVYKRQYQILVGKLIYLSHTRSDIAFAVNLVSQFMHSPMEEHEEAVFQILRYLKSSLGNGLFFKKSKQRGIEAYTYVDWAGSITNKRSISGYCTFVWGNLVTWQSKKQSVVARNSA
ncbi:hypothetical protein CXB51_010889 [Gossypium anomalum]|uniref:Reverse transcriptase Ty1/copia-type domain-containing protein n=1 Tax=Gossypium anomalum TaxID=47600 RepID=A0A8J5Z7Y0_9ROSI|nr:hypothetical protein CXB51_010889 [Gossypium anomalum]